MPIFRNRAASGLASIAVAALTQAPAAAQRFDDKLSLRVEAYFAGVGSSARAATNSGSLGTSIDFEEDLKLDRSQILPALELGWRINDDWVVQGQYYSLSRRTQASLEKDISFGETTFPVSARIGAGVDSDVYRLTIGNLLFQRDRLEIGAGIGLHATDFGLFQEGEGQVSGGPLRFRRESRRLFAPLPTIGAFGQWEPGRRWTLFGRVDWLSLGIDDYSGRLINSEASLSYSLHRNLDVGTSYRFVDYRVRVRRPDWNGQVRYQFAGPAIFLRAGF